MGSAAATTIFTSTRRELESRCSRSYLQLAQGGTRSLLASFRSQGQPSTHQRRLNSLNGWCLVSDTLWKHMFAVAVCCCAFSVRTLVVGVHWMWISQVEQMDFASSGSMLWSYDNRITAWSTSDNVLNIQHTSTHILDSSGCCMNLNGAQHSSAHVPNGVQLCETSKGRIAMDCPISEDGIRKYQEHDLPQAEPSIKLTSTSLSTVLEERSIRHSS